MSVVTVDSKGRILLPRDVRETMHVEPGDVLFLTQDGQFVTLTKAENPFDRLAAHAIAEYYAGETVSLEDTLNALDEDDAE
ncbi:MAG TPA: AbrB/MazE/SpoVT family DNA-binding domain-containing protein [Nitrolancea sp.]|nr:AbrB/MazE/SpoVT family DNA-binding domain-containing protein [Nitrolancea sp.]